MIFKYEKFQSIYINTMITKIGKFRSKNYLFELRKDTWVDNWNATLRGPSYLSIATRQNYKIYYDY